MFETGGSEDQWKASLKLLKRIRKLEGSIIKVIKDETGLVVLIYLQLRSQRGLYMIYGTLCLIDGTYRLLLTIKIALYTILVKNNTGNGRPVAYYLIKDETKESIQMGLQIFQTVQIRF